MKLKLNDEFICTRKENVLHVVSIYPDHDEIYKFQGLVADIIDLCFKEKMIFNHLELEKRLGQSVPESDWKDVQDFLLLKNIIQSE